MGQTFVKGSYIYRERDRLSVEMKDSVRTGSQPRVNTTQRHPVNLISFVATQYNLRYRFSRKQMAMTDVFCHILRKIYGKSKMNMYDSKGYIYIHTHNTQVRTRPDTHTRPCLDGLFNTSPKPMTTKWKMLTLL